MDVFVVVVEEWGGLVGWRCGYLEWAGAEFGFLVVHGCVGFLLGAVVVGVCGVVSRVWNCFD